MRRVLVSTGAAMMAVLLSSAPALAHECYNASRSAVGNAHAEAGQGLSSIDELYMVLCPAGAEMIQDAVAETGFVTDGVLVNVNAVMGGGAAEKGLKTTDGHDIDYLPTEVTGAIGQAFGACFGG
jgi:hypothetical protein